MLVASARDGSILVWDVGKKESTNLAGTSGVAYQVAFSNDGNSIAAASDDGVIRTWPTQQLTKAPTLLRGHAGPVYWVAYSPDGKSLASGSGDKTIRIWGRHPALRPEKTQITPPNGRAIEGQGSEASPDWTARISLPPDFGPVAAYVRSETDRIVVASKEGRLALFKAGWRDPIDDWRSPADVASLELEHDPDRIVTVSSSGLRASWPFFKDVSMLIQFAADHIPFEGKSRLTLSDNVRCKIAPPDSPCKTEPE
jgi:WD40 repeat protein